MNKKKIIALVACIAVLLLTATACTRNGNNANNGTGNAGTEENGTAGNTDNGNAGTTENGTGTTDNTGTTENGTTGTTDTAESTYTGTAQGYGGPVHVSVSVGANGQITGVTAQGEAETPEVGGNAIAAYNDDGFTPIIGSDVGAADVGAIDAVTGATFTSTAIKDALTEALAKVK